MRPGLLAILATAACSGSPSAALPQPDARVVEPEPDGGCALARLCGLDSLAGSAFGVGPDRFLVATGKAAMRLQLVTGRGAPLASIRIPTFVVDLSELVAQPLDGGLVALGERGDRELFLVSALPDLRAGPAIPLDGQLVSLGGHGRRLWICSRDFLRGTFVSRLDLDDPDAPAPAGELRLPGDCGSLAVSDDGARAFVNTSDGVRVLDADGLSAVIAPSAGVTTVAGDLVLRGPDAVRVLRQRDLVEVATIPARGALAATLAGGRLLVEGFRTVGPGMEGYVALWDLDGPEQLDEVILATTRFVGDPPGAFRSAVTAASVMTRLGGARLFDLSRGRLDELRLPALTPLGELAGPRAYGPAGSALVDLADPRAPAFASGGAYGIPSSADLALDEAGHLVFAYRSDDPAQATVGFPWDRDPLPIARWRLDGDGRPVPTGSLLLPGSGHALLLPAGDALYRLRPDRLQGWALATGAPTLDLALPSPSTAFDVDAAAGRAVVASGSSLLWIDLAAARVVEEVQLARAPRHLRVAGTRAVGTTGLDLLFFELGRGQVATVSSGRAYIDHLLWFDGRVVAYGQSLPFGLGVAPFGAAGPPPLPLDDVPRSLVVTGGGLVVGLPGELVTALLRCSPPL